MRPIYSLLVLLLVVLGPSCATPPPSGASAFSETSPSGGPAGLPAEWGNLEGTWLFHTDPNDVGEKEGWERPDHQEAGWRAIHVPGGWEEQGVTEPRPGQPPKPKTQTMSWTDYDGVAWYRLRFVVPKAWAGQELILSLGSVDDEDRTYLNGALVGATGPGVKRAVSVWRRYRVEPKCVKFGEENLLAIRVFDGGGPGGIKGPNIQLLPEKVMKTAKRLPDANRPLEARFADPPAQSRILKIIHSWPDEPEAQDMLICTLLSRGFGGVVCNVSFTDYLESEKRWQAFVRAVKQAKKVGMSLWLYDEHGYPSGTAGGIVLRGHPEWEARGLLIADAESKGGPATLDLPPGTLVQASAFPVADGAIDLSKGQDLSGQVQDRKLSWQAPAGHWKVMVITEDRLYEGTHAAHSLALKLPCTNLLMPEPTARFIEVTHQQYANHLSNDLGKWFVATFTDEPSLMSMFLRPMPYRVLPWSPNLPVEFERRRGYPLAPMIPALVADAGAKGMKARYDFWLTVGELVAEDFFGQIQTWCRRHNIPSGGHLLAEENFLGHVALYGDFFRCVRRLDAPSIDCLTSIPAQVPWFIARLIGSVADLEGRTVTMCETSDHVQRYRRPGDERPVQVVTEDEIRGTCNRLILGGINTITSYYSFNGLSGVQLRRLNEWVGRCCTMLTGGHQVADVALLYPIESVWPRFTPATQGPTKSPTAAQVGRAYRAAGDALFSAMRDFTYVDSQALVQAKVEDGALVHGKLRWRVVVLPCADTLPLAAWDNLAKFWRSGGVVIALSERPANSESEFPSPRVQALAKEMFGSEAEPWVTSNPAGGLGAFLPAGAEILLPVLLDAVLEPDVKPSAAGSPLRVTHRRIDGREVYFIINDSGAPWEGRVTLSVNGAGEQWDPGSGKKTPLASGDNISLKLSPYGGTFLRYAAPRLPQRRRAEPGRFPSVGLKPLSEVQPSVGKGQFVRSEVTGTVPLEQPAWQAIGTLTKGQVDTFLFLIFDYPKPLDLSKADCLVVETWAPEGQPTPTQVLVILRDADGVEYTASTGRSLAVPGRCRSFVPFSAFRRAGWSKGPEAALNLGKITGVRIGWGGYFGAEGEVVKFGLSLPQTATLRPGAPKL